MRFLKKILNTRGLALGLFAAAVALGALGACFVSVSVQTSSLKEFSKTWTSAPARVHAASLTEKDGRIEPVIRYSFWAGGREIESQRVFLAGGPIEDAEGGPGMIRFAYRDAKKERILREFFTGRETTVYYNPHRPEECALVREVLRDLKPHFFWGIGLVILAMIFLVKSLYDE